MTIRWVLTPVLVVLFLPPLASAQLIIASGISPGRGGVYRYRPTVRAYRRGPRSFATPYRPGNPRTSYQSLGYPYGSGGVGLYINKLGYLYTSPYALSRQTPYASYIQLYPALLPPDCNVPAYPTVPLYTTLPGNIPLPAASPGIRTVTAADLSVASPSSGVYRSFYPSSLTPTPPPRRTLKPQRTHLRVHVPAQAELWFEGFRSTQSGQERTFTTPPLEPGARYGYTVRIRWTHEGKTQELTGQIIVQGGQDRTIRLPDDLASTAQKR
jgi:uncharacterized protein (TIGR03000 family)